MSDLLINGVEYPDVPALRVAKSGGGYAEYFEGLTILSYGKSTWQDFLDAYNTNTVVYCRASSNSNPGVGAQGRMAFMAYVNNADAPTSVEIGRASCRERVCLSV